MMNIEIILEVKANQLAYVVKNCLKFHFLKYLKTLKIEEKIASLRRWLIEIAFMYSTYSTCIKIKRLHFAILKCAVIKNIKKISLCSILTIYIFINYRRNEHEFIYCDKIMNEFYISVCIFSYKQLDHYV